MKDEKYSPTFGECILTALQQQRQDRMEDLRDEGRVQQKTLDLVNAVAAFLDLGADEIKIYRLLKKYFSLDMMSEFDKYIKWGKIQQVEQYLVDKGESFGNAHNFVKSHDLAGLLRENEKTIKMAPEKIVELLGKR